MKKFFLVLFVIMMTASCVYNGVRHPQERLSNAELLEQKTVALVEISEKHQNELHAYCTGVWVSKDVILTANHCVADLGKPAERLAIEEMFDESDLEEMGLPAWNPVGQVAKYSVQSDIHGLAGKKSFEMGKVLASDEADDLALIKADKEGLPSHPVATLSRDVIHDGDPLSVVGHTVGLWWSFIPGTVSATRTDLKTHGIARPVLLQVSTSAFYGNSGGGAWDANGNLVGICSFLAPAVPNLVFFVHRDVVKSFLDHNKI